MSHIKCVKICYGPTYSYHSYIHRPQKLHGLRDALRRLGYYVELVPVDTINYCRIEMRGLDIFQCNIDNLMFNQPTYADEVAQRAVAAVQLGSKVLLRSCNLDWARTLVEDKIFETIAHGLLKLKLQYQRRDIDCKGLLEYAMKGDQSKLGPTTSWPFPHHLLLDLDSPRQRQDSECVQDQDQQNNKKNNLHPLKSVQQEPDELSLELNQQRLDLSRQLIETFQLQI